MKSVKTKSRIKLDEKYPWNELCTIDTYQNIEYQSMWIKTLVRTHVPCKVQTFQHLNQIKSTKVGIRRLYKKFPISFFLGGIVFPILEYSFGADEFFFQFWKKM